MPKITPCLWFASQALEAAKFYVSIFKDSRIVQIVHYPQSAAKASGRPKGSVMTVRFLLDGQEFLGLNGGPHHQFSPAVSFMVNCATQKEIDKLWRKLCAGGKEIACGWLEDKFGVSWQIVPAELPRLLDDSRPDKTDRVMGAVVRMTKLDLKALRLAHSGRG